MTLAESSFPVASRRDLVLLPARQAGPARPVVEWRARHVRCGGTVRHPGSCECLGVRGGGELSGVGAHR
jgi:hypothetical protein